MTPERYERIGQLFDQALERSPRERDAWLEQACSGDAGLHDEVKNLLANYSESENFLSRPALNVAASILARQEHSSLVDRKIGPYQIRSLLGAGGMGEVYLAEDARLRRKIALKVLPDIIARDTDRLRRFEQEAFAASALNHPNILTIYEFGVEGDTHFLAAEFIDGETLRDCLQRGPLPLAAALDIAAQTSQALAAAHAAGIIHRDIKPENVMIRNDGIVKVLDFGLAKLVGPPPAAGLEEGREAEPRRQEMTRSGMIMGTVAYMSPEQGRGKTIDARADIFSLGVLLYEMLSGRHPFLGETLSHTMVAILENEPPPLAQFVNNSPAELASIIDRALAKNPDDRYASATALLADLKKLQKRLEFAAELEYTAATRRHEAPSQIRSGITREPDDEVAKLPGQTPATRPTGAARYLLPGGLAVLLVLGVAAGLWLRPGPVTPPTAATAPLPERSLTYSLTVQEYLDGRPNGNEFQASGREIFKSGWKFKLNLSSPQDGFLYLLNQEPSGAFRLLFPLPTLNDGSPRLEANQRLQTNSYVFEQQPGTERFRLIWAAQAVPELEPFRALLNPADKGLIGKPDAIRAVKEFLQQHEASRADSIHDQQSKLTRVSARGDLLVALVELEHR